MRNACGGWCLRFKTLYPISKLCGCRVQADYKCAWTSESLWLSGFIIPSKPEGAKMKQKCNSQPSLKEAFIVAVYFYHNPYNAKINGCYRYQKPYSSVIHTKQFEMQYFTNWRQMEEKKITCRLATVDILHGNALYSRYWIKKYVNSQINGQPSRR